MTRRVTNDRTEGDIMGRIREGMEVYDSNQKKVGQVESLFMGARADADEVGGDPALTTGTGAARDDSLIENIAEAFDDGLPDVVRRRLRHNGFIRLDGGLLSGRRYALREHIASVAGDRVILNIRGEDLISA